MTADGALAVDLRITRGAFALDVAFEAPPGVTLLLGPSGAGKSTVLAAIAGILTPDSGRIALGGEALFDASAGVSAPPHRRRLGYVPQALGLFPHLTGRENAAYGIDRSVPRAERARRADEALERFGVGAMSERMPRSFSGGEAQRVALARAVAMGPRALLLDEPFSALDRALREALERELREAARALAIPVVHATHHPEEVARRGDQAVALRGGVVVSARDVGERWSE